MTFWTFGIGVHCAVEQWCVHAFAGYMGGQFSMQKTQDDDVSVTCTIKPNFNTGVYGQFGTAFGQHRIFGTLG
jgi:hypothetical protein